MHTPWRCTVQRTRGADGAGTQFFYFRIIPNMLLLLLFALLVPRRPANNIIYYHTHSRGHFTTYNILILYRYKTFCLCFTGAVCFRVGFVPIVFQFFGLFSNHPRAGAHRVHKCLRTRKRANSPTPSNRKPRCIRCTTAELQLVS